MKYVIKLSLIVVLVAGLVMAGVPLVAEPEVAAASGYWQQVEVLQEQQPGDEYDTMVFEPNLIVNRHSEVYEDQSGEHTKVIEASARWQEPLKTYQPEEPFDIDASVSLDVYENVYMGYWEEFEVQVSIDYVGEVPDTSSDSMGVLDYSYYEGSSFLEDASGKDRALCKGDASEIQIAEDRLSVKGQFPVGRNAGDRFAINYYFDGMHGRGNIHYVYEWVEGEVKVEPVIELTGLVRSLEDKPMPWMKLQAKVFYGATALDLEREADLIVDFASDHLGRYGVSIPLQEDDQQPVGILLTGTLTCVYPGTLEPAFYFVDVADVNSADSREVSVASWIAVDPAQQRDAARPDEPIRINRLLSYSNLSRNAFSFDEKGRPDPGLYYGADPASGRLLQNYSTLYTAAFDAWFFGAVVLGESEKLLAHPVPIEVRWPATADLSSSHFDPRDSTIRLTAANSLRDDRSRFTILHEFGHAFDFISNGSEKFRTSDGYGAGDTPHGGYFNQTTADSFLEGFATMYAALVQKFSGYPNPEVLDWIDLTQPNGYLAFGRNGADEEFAMAAVLYHALRHFGSIADYWYVLRQDLTNYADYYELIRFKLKQKSASLEATFKEDHYRAGLFRIPFGDGQYNLGEPFRDAAPQNGRYDDGESYADLFYAVDADGRVDFSKTLRRVNVNTLDYGFVTDARSDRQARKTIDRPANGFLTLSGEPVDYVLVSLEPENGAATRVLRAVEGNRVFIGISDSEYYAAGRLEVAVPGGQVIYQGDLADLQGRQRETIGLDVPLAEAVVEAADLAEPGTEPVAAYGEAEATGVLSVPEMSVEQLAELAAGYEPDAPMSQVVGDLLARSPDAAGLVDALLAGEDGVTGGKDGGRAGDAGGSGLMVGLSGVFERVKGWLAGMQRMAIFSLIGVLLASIGLFALNRASLKNGARRRRERAAALREAREAREVEAEERDYEGEEREHEGEVEREGEEELSAVNASAPKAAAQARCPQCGEAVKPGKKFCSTCGSKLATGKFCGECGAPLKATAKFCGQCGAKQE